MKAATAREIVRSTAEAAFASDQSGRIVEWNAAAERVLGLPAGEAVGRRCRDVMEGRDIFGNRFCQSRCGLHEMARLHEAVHDFEIDIPHGNGNPARFLISAVVVRGRHPSHYTIVHILRPAGVTAAAPAPWEDRAGDPAGGGEIRAAGGDGHDVAGPFSMAADLIGLLTPRELEVLRLMSEGAETGRIASALCISPTTVRNHIQHILRKLHVHSKVQAVALALRPPR